MDVALIAVNLILTAVLMAAVALTLFGLPGNFLILLVAAGYAAYEGFARFDQGFLLVLGGLFLLGEGVEFAAAALGAKRRRASRRAVAAACLGGFVGALAGSAVLPVFGTIAGAAAGAFALSYLAEYGKTGDRGQAARVARSAAAGLVAGTLFKIVVAVAMVVAVVSRLPWN